MTTALAISPTQAKDPQTQDDVMTRLRAAAEVSDPHDVSAFVAAYRTIDWGTRPADDVAEAVRLALWVGAYTLAQELALQGSERFPHHAELQKLAYVLAPPKVTISQRPPDPSVGADMVWLKKHWNDYKGKWVAVRSGELLAVADSLDGLIEQVGEIKNTGILVTSIW